jgi:hypothetical protein
MDELKLSVGEFGDARLAKRGLCLLKGLWRAKARACAGYRGGAAAGLLDLVGS